MMLCVALAAATDAASAQWQHRGVFPNDSFMGGSGCHGLAVDGEGKVWIQLYNATASIFDGVQTREVRQIFVYNPDGTPASFSGFMTITIEGVTDTLWGPNRGLRRSHDGNILIASGDILYKVHPATGAGLAKVVPIPTFAPTAPAVSSDGTVFTAPVLPGHAIQRFSADLVFDRIAVEASQGFSRSFEVSGDKRTIFWAGYTNNAVYKYVTDEPVAGAYTLRDTILKGISAESFAWNPATKNLWISAGSYSWPPNQYPGVTTAYSPGSWYALDTTSGLFVDSLAWVFTIPGSADERPRAIDFTPSGDTAYVAVFGSSTVPCVRRYVYDTTASIILQAPNGGETWRAGSVRQVLWSCNKVAAVDIDYSIDGGETWLRIVTDLPSIPSTFSWTIPDAPSSTCLVRISNHEDPSVADSSASYFTISKAGLLEETEPNNTAAEADHTEYGDSVNASINPEGDVDYFTFSALAGDTVEVTAWKPTGSLLNGRIAVFDAGGMQLGGSVTYEFVERAVVQIPMNGWYYIRYSYAGNYIAFPNINGNDEIQAESRRGRDNAVLADTGGYRIALRRFAPSAPLLRWVSTLAMYSDACMLLGEVNPCGLSTIVSFEYGLTTSFGSEVAAPANPISGLADLAVVSPLIEGLTPNTTYYSRLKAVNSLGTSYGPYGAFITPAQAERWQRQFTGELRTIVNVVRINNRRGVAVGSTGLVLWTSDGGETWTPGVSGSTAQLYGVSFVDSLSGIVVTTSGEILRTTDGGAIWSLVHTAPGSLLTDMRFSDRQNGTAVGGPGAILRTTDAGLTWISQSIATTKYFRGVSFSDSLHGVVSGDSGTIYHTSDAGVTWNLRPTGFSNILRGVCFATPQRGIVVGDLGRIMQSTDGGISWNTVSTPTTTTLHNVSFSDSVTGRIVGGSGTILLTTDGGSTWTLESSGTIHTLRGISMYGNSHGTAVGSNGAILDFQAPSSKAVAVTQGWNMVSVPLAQGSMDLPEVFPDASSSAFTFAGSYVIRPSASLAEGYWLKFASAGSVSLHGSPTLPRDIPVTPGWNMIGAYDLESETSSISSTPSGIVQTPFYEFSAGYLAASALQPGRGYWVRTSGTGLLHLPGGSPKVSGMHMFAYNEWPTITFENSTGAQAALYVADEEATRGRDLGLPPLPPQDVLDVRFADNRNIVHNTPGSHAVILQCAEYPLSITGTNLGDLRLRITVIGEGKPVPYDLSEAKGVELTQRPSSLTIEIVGSGQGIPTEYSLSQNYPNPFNPTTIIRFGLPVGGRATLTVYDLLGRLVATPVERELDAGYHEAIFDAAGMASGVYFYRLEAGSYVEGRKMVILK